MSVEARFVPIAPSVVARQSRNTRFFGDGTAWLWREYTEMTSTMMKAMTLADAFHPMSFAHPRLPAPAERAASRNPLSYCNVSSPLHPAHFTLEFPLNAVGAARSSPFPFETRIRLSRRPLGGRKGAIPGCR